MSDSPTTTAPPAPGPAPGAPAVEDAAIRTALSSNPPASGASPLSAVLTFGWRGMLKIKHVPEQLIDVTLTPVLFTLLFTYMYGGAISGSTDDYLQFLLPGTLVMSVLFTTVYSGVSLNTDVTKGVVDRFRSLPTWRPAPLVGAVVGDVLRYLLAGTVVIVVGLALGYRPESWAGVVWALLLLIIFSVALSWVFTTVGLLMRAPNAVMNTGFMALFPLIFVSNGFVPQETLPGWLETLVDLNPITHVVTAVRGLMDGTATGGDISLVLVEAAVLALIFAPLTTRLYRTRG
jgi:ABC-2 type transport system permease protein